MRIECPACASVASATLATTPAGITATCGACGATTVVEAAPTPTVAPDPTPRCPKCDTPWVEQRPCARCGLAPARAAAWQAVQAVAPTAALDAAWAACEAAWTDDAVHERAAATALETRDYGWLAGRYRHVLRARPDDAVARARLDVLARRAQAALVATASPPTAARGVRKVPWVAIAVAVVALGAVAVYASYVARTHRQATGARRPALPAAPAAPRSLPGPSIEAPPPGR
ncbi:MAG: hypothetical protein R3B06_23025 [Kofleriaceae bacterium]